MLFCLVLISLISLPFISQRSTAQSHLPQSYSHPRLFFSSETIARLRSQANSTHRTIWEPILAYVESQVNEQPPADTPPDTKESEYTIYGSRLIPFAFVCVITEAPQYCDLARRYLLAYANWTLWDEDGQRGMGLAFMVYGNTLAYDWMYPMLSPEERQRVAASLALWAGRLQEASQNVTDYDNEWRNWWGKSYLQNHYWVTHSALGLAGLALLGDSIGPVCTITARSNVNLRAGPSTHENILGVLQAGQSAVVVGRTTDDAGYAWYQLTNQRWVRSDVVTALPECDQTPPNPQDWVDYARGKLSIGRDILESIQDGSWHESIYYQTTTLCITIPFMYNLRELQGTDIFPHYYLQHYIDWRLYNHIPHSTQYLFSHGDFEWSYHNGLRPQNILRFLANEYDSGSAEWLAEQIAAADGANVEVYSAPWYVLDFLYYDPEVTPLPPQEDLPSGLMFPDFEGVILRTGWETDDLIFGFKSGTYGGRYAFETFVNGYYPWEAPCDVTGCTLNVGHDHDDTNGFYLYGNGVWLAPETAGVAKTNTAYHNSLLIDGQGQYRPPDDHYGAYPEDFYGRDGFLEQYASSPGTDYIAGDATQRYGMPDISDITRHVFFIRPGYFLMIDSIQASAPHRYTWISHFDSSVAVESNRVIGRSSQGAGLSILPVWPQSTIITTGNDGQPFAHIEPAEAAQNTLLIHLLEPLSNADLAPSLSAAVVEDTGSMVLIRVQHNDGQQEDMLLRYGANQITPLAIGPYEFDGQAAVIRLNAEGQVQSVFFFGGSTLQHTDYGDLLASPSIPVEPVTLHVTP